MIEYSPVTVVAAEGARVGFTTCSCCAAALVIDPRVPESVTEKHTAWHHTRGEF